MGELVREHGLRPDLVISSDAVRARLTAEAMAEAARYAGEVLLDQHLYLAGPADILSLLRTVRESADTVMIAASRSSSTSLALGPTVFNERETTHFDWVRHAAAKACPEPPR
jgi:phosphohistidine phosphatase